MGRAKVSPFVVALLCVLQGSAVLASPLDLFRRTFCTPITPWNCPSWDQSYPSSTSFKSRQPASSAASSVAYAPVSTVSLTTSFSIQTITDVDWSTVIYPTTYSTLSLPSSYNVPSATSFKASSLSRATSALKTLPTATSALSFTSHAQVTSVAAALSAPPKPTSASAVIIMSTATVIPSPLLMETKTTPNSTSSAASSTTASFSTHTGSAGVTKGSATTTMAPMPTAGVARTAVLSSAKVVGQLVAVVVAGGLVFRM